MPLVRALPDRGVLLVASESAAKDRRVLLASIVGVLPNIGKYFLLLVGALPDTGVRLATIGSAAR